jgi:hypothetical protein
MPDRHRHRGLVTRPPGPIRKAATSTLAEHGWTMQDFVTACLVAVAADPEDFLGQLAEHRAGVRKSRPASAPATEEGT